MSVRAELEAYAREPALAAGAGRALDLLRHDGPRALRRQEQSPHLTASGVILDPSGREVLLVRHERLGGWVQAGGHLEEGDRTLREAALRELEEETGVPIDVLSAAPEVAPLRVREFEITGGTCRAHVDTLFVIRLATRAEPGPGSAWFDLEDLPTDLLPDLVPVLAGLRATPP